MTEGFAGGTGITAVRCRAACLASGRCSCRRKRRSSLLQYGKPVRVRQLVEQEQHQQCSLAAVERVVGRGREQLQYLALWSTAQHDSQGQYPSPHTVLPNSTPPFLT